MSQFKRIGEFRESYPEKIKDLYLELADVGTDSDIDDIADKYDISRKELFNFHETATQMKFQDGACKRCKHLLELNGMRGFPCNCCSERKNIDSYFEEADENFLKELDLYFENVKEEKIK